jgi:hypothetical protein
MVTVNSDYYPSCARPWEEGRLASDIQHVNTLAAPDARMPPLVRHPTWD